MSISEHTPPMVNTSPLKFAAWCYIISPILTPALIAAPIVLYLQRQQLQATLPGHYTFLMRTFFISILGLVAVALASALGGPLGFVIWVIWIVGRGWTTLSLISDSKEQDAPNHLWWG